MSIVQIARAELRELAPYSAAEQVEGNIRLNANEAAFRHAADTFRRPLNRYPEVRPSRLRGLLAAYYGVAPQQLLLTRGSSEAIDLLLRCFCRAGRDNVVTPAPTFSMYRHYAAVQDAALREVPLDADFSIRAPAILAACDAETRLLFLCSPNNPTGTTLARESLVEILAGRNGRTAVVVDEAYAEFSDEPSALDLLDSHDNLIVLRTLSKALGLAGARCGAVIGPPDVIRLLDAVQAPYAMPTPVIECMEDALSPEHLDEARSNVASTVLERRRLAVELERLPFVRQVWPSGGNFLFVRLEDAPRVLELTKRNRILIRHFGKELADCVRITVGTPRENECLLDCLRNVGS